MALPPIIHRGVGLAGVAILALCAGVLPLALLLVVPAVREAPLLPFAGGFALAGFALRAFDRHASLTAADVVDPDSGVRQRVVPARHSVFFIPLSLWGAASFAVAVLVLAWAQ